MMSSSQNKGMWIMYCTPPNKHLLKSQTMALIAMMRGQPKDGYHRGRSNKHFKQNCGITTIVFYATSNIQGQHSMCPKPRIPFFLFTSIGVQKWPILVKVSAPMRLALQGSHVWRQYQKQSPLRSKSSTIKGLLYARWSSCCKAFVARKVRTITLEQSARKLT